MKSRDNVLNYKKPVFWGTMIAISAVCAVGVFTVFSGPQRPALEHTFEIYMVVVPEDGIYRIDGDDLDALPLEKEPILTDKDLVAYHWRVKECTDILEVRDGVSISERLREKDHKGAGAGMSPFVVVCSGERIYVGVFSSPISSLSLPKYASVYINAMISDQNTYEVLALKDQSEKLLHDPRTYDALDALRKLKDYTHIDAPSTDKGISLKEPPELTFFIQGIFASKQ